MPHTFKPFNFDLLIILRSLRSRPFDLTIDIPPVAGFFLRTPDLQLSCTKMLEGAPKFGAGRGTPDRNLDMGAFRDQEEGGMQVLPSQHDAQLKHISGLLLLSRHVAHHALHDSDERQNAPKCEPHTHVEALCTVMKWARDYEKEEAYLWLYGPKSSGKSAISQTIADWCEAEGLLAASFFFARDSEGSNDQMSLGATLIYQFLRFIPEIRPLIINSLEQNPSLLRRSINTQLESLLIKPLQAAFTTEEKHNLVPRIIIIDGLDECADDQAQIYLLETFAELLSQNFIPIRLRFMISSRPEKHLQYAFCREPLKSATIHLNVGGSTTFSQTISRYRSRGKLGVRVADPLLRPASPTPGHASIYTHISMLTTGAPPPTPEVRPCIPRTSESIPPFSVNMDLSSTSSDQSSTPDSISTVTGDTTPSWSSIWRSHSYRTSQTSLASTNYAKSLPLGEISDLDVAANDLRTSDGSSTRSRRSGEIPYESIPPTFTLPPPMLSPMEPSPSLTVPQQIQSSAIHLDPSNPPNIISPISSIFALSPAYDHKPVSVDSATTAGGFTFEVWRSQARERKPSSSFLGHRFGKKRATPQRAHEGRGSTFLGAIIRTPDLLSYLDESSLFVLGRTCKRMQYEVEKKRYRCVHLIGDALVKPFESAMAKDPRRTHFVFSYIGSLLKGEWLRDAVHMKHLVISRYNNTTGFFSTGPFPFHLETFELRDSAPNFYKGQEIANHIRRFLETQRSLHSLYIEDNTNYHIFLEQFKPLSANACPQVVAFGGNIFAAEVFLPSGKIVYFQWDKLDQAIPFAGGYEFVFEDFLARIAKPLSRIRALSVSLSDELNLCLPPTVHAFGSFFPSLYFLEIKNLSHQVCESLSLIQSMHLITPIGLE